jgi:hypothetical protein
MSTMANDGEALLIFLCFWLRFFYLFMFFAWQCVCSCLLVFYSDLWPKWTRLSHTTTLKASVHFYCLHICQFTTEIITSPIAAYFFRILRKRRRIFRVFNLCIFTHGILQQVDLSFYCGLVIFTNIKLSFKLIFVSILICVLKANLQLS